MIHTVALTKTEEPCSKHEIQSNEAIIQRVIFVEKHKWHSQLLPSPVLGNIYHIKKWVYLRSLLLQDRQPCYLGIQVNLDSRAEMPSKDTNMNNNNKNKASFL